MHYFETANKKEEARDPDAFHIDLTKQGSGEYPPKGSKVSVHYTGRLLDGSEFDSSKKRNQPFQFNLGTGQVIKCWDEAFQKLNRGAEATITCPADMAYGSRGAGGKIPPNATLKFDIELLDFN